MSPASEVRAFVIGGTAIAWVAAALTLPFVAGSHRAAVAVGVLAVPAVLGPVAVAAFSTWWIRPVWGVVTGLAVEFVVTTVVAAFACFVWLSLEQRWHEGNSGLGPVLMIVFLVPVLSAAAVLLGTLIGGAARYFGPATWR